MKQTNYHLFDFLDFDTELKTDESLWKACKPTSIYEKGGDMVKRSAIWRIIGIYI